MGPLSCGWQLGSVEQGQQWQDCSLIKNRMGDVVWEGLYGIGSIKQVIWEQQQWEPWNGIIFVLTFSWENEFLSHFLFDCPKDGNKFSWWSFFRKNVFFFSELQFLPFLFSYEMIWQHWDDSIGLLAQGRQLVEGGMGLVEWGQCHGAGSMDAVT